MKHSARYINCTRMRATHARILVCLALAKSHVSISQEGNQQVQIMMHAVIDGSGV